MHSQLRFLYAISVGQFELGTSMTVLSICNSISNREFTSSIYGNRSYNPTLRWGPVHGAIAGQCRKSVLGSLHCLANVAPPLILSPRTYAVPLPLFPWSLEAGSAAQRFYRQCHDLLGPGLVSRLRCLPYCLSMFRCRLEIVVHTYIHLRT